jgi:hypothetical protein
VPSIGVIDRDQHHSSSALIEAAAWSVLVGGVHRDLVVDVDLDLDGLDMVWTLRSRPGEDRC